MEFTKGLLVLVSLADQVFGGKVPTSSVTPPKSPCPGTRDRCRDRGVGGASFGVQLFSSFVEFMRNHEPIKAEQTRRIDFSTLGRSLWPSASSAQESTQSLSPSSPTPRELLRK